VPPLPKDPEVRQRQNKAATRVTLTADEPARPEMPVLPDRRTKDGALLPWNDLTVAWWVDVWASPMATQYLDADVHGLIRTAFMVDAFWYDPDPKLAGEIRQQLRMYGLTPMDRRSLEWSIKRPEAPRAAPAQESRPETAVADSRSVLSVLNGGKTA
jgi:hypothetical protein